MKEKTVKTPERKDRTALPQIADFLTKTGFILEMEVAELLKKSGYNVMVNQYFFDYDESKKREIDIIAYKTVNETKITLMVECKQSTTHDWIFVCSDRRPSRWYGYLKYFPHAPYRPTIRETKVFDHLLTLDDSVPLAQNSIIRDITGKPSDSRQINECIKKLPKALVDYANDIDRFYERTILVPLTVFSGQIFTAEYDGKLVIKEVDHVQYGTELDSNPYVYHYNDQVLRSASFILGKADDDDEEKKNSAVAEVSRELGERYLIDFVTKKRFKKFLEDVEKRVEKIDLSKWPLKQKEEKISPIV